MRLKYYLMKVSVALLRGLYAPMKLRRTRNRITIISRQSKSITLDIALLSDYIRTNHPDTECLVLVRFIEQGILSKIHYGFHILSQMWAIAASEVVVLDGYCITACVLNHKEDLQIVQMWHALAAIKKFGYQTVDKESGHSRQVAKAMCMHRNYDHIIAPSIATGRIFADGFHSSEDKVKLLGLPRIDRILEARAGTDAEREFREKIREEYGIKEGQEILLYVPTFRRGRNVDVASLREAIDEDRYRLVVKLHPLYDTEDVSDRKYSTYDWLKACDRVITDYSALGVEAAIIDKPLYYYVYDIDAYRQEVGLNVDPTEEMPQATALTSADLMRLLEEEYDYDSLARFRDRYISVDMNNCTKQLGDFLYGLTL